MFQHKYAADIWYHANRRRESECFYSFEGCIMHCMTVAEYRKKQVIEAEETCLLF